jgi:hypothetical protein|tara:strand:+ start:43 stop:1065 length:1023 start_codon:yes stop_codon:yes gene_type:complete
MATLRSDIIIPEVFTPYLIEQTTQRDAFLASGVVQPMAELNAAEGGGDHIQVPFYKANLTGDFERLTDSSSLTPGKITASKQVAPILHVGRAFESRDLAALASGSDPMAAIGNKIADYIANQRQKDLLACLAGIFGAVDDNSSASFAALTVDGATGDTPTVLGPRQIVEGKSILGDQGEKLAALVVHPKVYYDLMERRALDFVYDNTGTADSDATQGSTANAFGQVGVPTFMGMRVIVSADVQTTGSGSSTEYASYMFTQGAVGSGEQLALQTETDRDILAKSDAMSFDLHYVYHPIGSSFTTTVSNPTRAQLETVGNWTKVYETNNIGIVRITSTSNLD